MNAVEVLDTIDRPHGKRRFTIKSIDVYVGNQLRVERDSQGLSRKEVADIVGLSQQMLSKYEHGESTISISALYAIAAALEYDPLNALPATDDMDDTRGPIEIAASGRRSRAMQEMTRIMGNAEDRHLALINKVARDIVDGFKN